MQAEMNLPELPSDFKFPDISLLNHAPQPFYFICDGEVYYNADGLDPHGYLERVDVGPVEYV